MSWSPELFIGGMRPWPDTVHVVRSQTDEMRRYVPEGENERLRELLRHASTCASGRYCYGCPHQYDGCDINGRIRDAIGEEDA